MLIKKKIVLTICVTFVCIVGGLYIGTNKIVLESFVKLEEQFVRVNVKRVINAINDDLSNLESTGGDWAAWNLTRDFVLNGNEQYIKDNLETNSLVTIRVNFMIFINSSGQVVYSKGANLVTGSDQPVSKDLINHIATHKSLMQHTHTKDAKTGIINLPGEAVLIASYPISNNDVTGPVHGTLVIGRYFIAPQIIQTSFCARAVDSITPE